LVQLHRPGVRVAAREAERAGEVHVLDDHLAAGRAHRRQPTDHPVRVRDVGEQKPRVPKVVGVITKVVGRAYPKLYVAQTTARGRRAGEVNDFSVDVNADHRSARPNHASELHADVASAAAKVQASRPDRHTCRRQQPRAGRPHNLGEDVQARLAGQPAINRVPGHQRCLGDDRDRFRHIAIVPALPVGHSADDHRLCCPGIVRTGEQQTTRNAQGLKSVQVSKPRGPPRVTVRWPPASIDGALDEISDWDEKEPANQLDLASC
jgi:hypothetical protein